MNDLLTQVFGAGKDLSLPQESARAALIFAYGLVLVRVAGRRVFGKWSALDIIVSVMVGSNLSRAMTGGAALWPTLAATTLLLVLHWILAQLAARFRMASRILEGKPVSLAAGGKVQPDVQKRYAVSEADLNEALRQSGVSEVHEANEMTLEPSGRITVLKRKQRSPS